MNETFDVIMRVDGSHEIGLGHIMRCLVISDELTSRGFNVLFLMKNFENSCRLVSEHDFDIELFSANSTISEESNITKELIVKYRPKIVFTDILNIDNKYLESIKETGVFLVSIDDLGGTFCSNLVINGHLNANKINYDDFGTTEYLLGKKYLIIGDSFFVYNNKSKKINKNVKKIIVSLGGSDDHKIFKLVFDSLENLSGNYSIIFIIGSAFKDFEEFNTFLSKSKKQYDVRYNVSNMAELIYDADLAIISGGNIKYETAVIGTPAIIICGTNEEYKIAENFVKHESSINVGLIKRINSIYLTEIIKNIIFKYELRKYMSVCGKKLIDGCGTKRVVDYILERVLK